MNKTSVVNESYTRSHSLDIPPAAGGVTKKRVVTPITDKKNGNPSFELNRWRLSARSSERVPPSNKNRRRIKKFLRVMTGVAIGATIGTTLGGPVGTVVGVALGTTYIMVGPEKLAEVAQRAAVAVYKQAQYAFQRAGHAFKKQEA